MTLGEIESKSWGSVGQSDRSDPPLAFSAKNGVMRHQGQGPLCSGRGLKNSQFVSLPSNPTPYGSAGKRGNEPIGSAANGIRSVWESWREMQIIADGRSRTGKRSIGEGASGPRAPPRGPLLIDGTGSFNQYLRHVVPTWANMYFSPRSSVTYMYC